MLTLVGAWAYVLVPMLLRRHDRCSAAQSVEISTGASARVLARRSRAAGLVGRVISADLEPEVNERTRRPRASGAEVPGDIGWAIGRTVAALAAAWRRVTTTVAAAWRRVVAVVVAAQTRLRAAMSPRSQARSRAQVLAWRRRRLVGLVCLVLASVSTALVRWPLAWAAAALAVLACVGYVVHLRRSARRAAAARRAQRAATAARRRAIPVTEWIYAVPNPPVVARPRAGAAALTAEPTGPDSRWELESAVS